jgi:hypothetical protein
MRSILRASLSILLMPSAYAASLPGDSALEKQLASCTHMAKKEFSASETHDLLRYLNDQFYHFR